MKESVLIINNDSDTEKQLEVFLTRKGFITYKAEHGLKALRILNNTNISVIIYELISEEQAEFGFMEYIKKKHPSIQVLIITDSQDINLILDSMKNGAFDLIGKPVDEERLLSTINKAISEKKEIEHRISSDKRNREYQKILIKELEMTKRELERVKEDLGQKSLELELIYGKSYNEKHTEHQVSKSNERIGKYTVLEEIGKGGMSVVYKAIDPVLNREVAIKELTITQRPLPADILEDLKKRFKKEAQVIAMLRHDNIVKVFDIIEENNKHYMIMEYIDGKTLDKIISGSKRLPILEAVNIVSDVCLAIDYIHANNIIHRDIKPSNVIVASDRNVKLMDFGVIRDTSVSTITPTGSIVGTIAYTAPEQSSKSIDYRVDIFSLGTILYELITGKNPFEGETYADTFLKISSFTPDPPSSVNPECPPELDLIVMKALEKNPNKRFAKAADFHHALVTFTRNYEISIA